MKAVLHKKGKTPIFVYADTEKPVPKDAECGFGGFAEYATVPESFLAVKPSNMSFETAASVPLAAVTALQALRRGDIRFGQKVLIIGAGGGVGTFTVQLAKHFGSEVTAMCGEKNVPVARSLGVAHIIDYTRARPGESCDCG